MPSMFAALEDQLSDVVDTMFAETFDFLPMTQPTVNSRLAADAGREMQTVVAVLDDRNPGSTSFARLGKTSGGVASSGGPPQFSTTSPMLFVDERRFSGGLMPARRLDRFRRAQTGDVFEVTGLERDGQGRWKIGLTKVAKE